MAPACAGANICAFLLLNRGETHRRMSRAAAAQRGEDAMSQDAFVDFYENYLNSDQGKADRKVLLDADSEDKFCQAAATRGKAAGFDFSEDEVRSIMKASAQAAADGELGDEQLEQVAGGASYAIRKVQIGNIGRFGGGVKIDPGKLGSISTVMCPW